MILLIIGGIFLGIVLNTHLSQPNTIGYIELMPDNTTSADDPRVIHLTEQDFTQHPALEMMLSGENPALAAWFVRDGNNPNNPQPFIVEPDGSRIYSAYSMRYVEWNRTVYRLTGWIT
ncbi:MAG: hypothetical protein O0W93_04680 [Methanocorpusculum sp.]|nr:hypothetical protein [Methanocorpusculum sp.]